MTDTYKEYPNRYLILLGFSLCTAINGCCWLSGPSIHDEMAIAYNASDTFLTFCGLVFMLTYVFFGFGANFIIQKYGLRIGILAGIILTGIGMWIKVFVNSSKYLFMLGNTFAGLGQPFFLNSSSLLALTWFSDSSRALATTCASMANNVGNAFGSMFPTFFVNKDQ